jgi:hypothetical protein
MESTVEGTHIDDDLIRMNGMMVQPTQQPIIPLYDTHLLSAHE